MNNSGFKTGGGRIKYIDTLRGFTMLLVVFEHVRLFALHLPLEVSPFAAFFVAFRMPMFFFISGYIAYKSSNYWSFSSYSSRLLNKAKVQLIPTVVFWSIFVYFQIRPWGFPSGFWFTEVLFEMFVIYYSVAFLLKRINPIVEDFVLIVLGLLLFVFSYKISLFSFSSYLSLYNLGNYFILFTFGLLCRKYNDIFIRFITNKWLLTLSIIIPLINLFAIYGPANVQVTGIYWELTRLINGVLLVCVIFTLFRNSADYWNKNGVVQKCFEFIGRRTLDLYMLHYFLLPSLPELGKYFADGHNYTLEFFVVALITVIVTGCALAISAFLRTSPVLAKYLFGVAQKTALSK